MSKIPDRDVAAAKIPLEVFGDANGVVPGCWVQSAQEIAHLEEFNQARVWFMPSNIMIR